MRHANNDHFAPRAAMRPFHVLVMYANANDLARLQDRVIKIDLTLPSTLYIVYNLQTG